MTIGQLTGGGGAAAFTSPIFLAGKLIGANMNSVLDQAIPVAGSSLWQIERVLVTNASISLTTARGALYGAASKTTPLFAMLTTSTWSALTAASKTALLARTPGTVSISGSLAGDATYDKTLTNIYLSLTTAQGAAATADFYIFGIDLSNLPNHP